MLLMGMLLIMRGFVREYPDKKCMYVKYLHG